MTTAPPRQGPALRIEGSCEWCAHARRLGPPMDGKWLYQCSNPSATPEQREHMWTSPTPAWCPPLPAARLALARGIVADSQPSTLDLVLPADAAIHRRMGSTPIVDSDALFGQELRVYPSKEPTR